MADIEESPIGRVHRAISKFLKYRDFPGDPPPFAQFADEFGRGKCAMRFKRQKAGGSSVPDVEEKGQKNVLLIVVINDETSKNVDYEKYFHTLDPKLKNTDRGYTIETLLIRQAKKNTERLQFSEWGVTENVKTFSQMIGCPLTHINGWDTRIMAHTEVVAMRLDGAALSKKPRDDPVVFWLGGKPGDYLEQRSGHENSGYELKYYYVE